MMKQDRPYKVYKIENGTVIDHIPAGKGIKVMQVLGLDAPASNKFIALGINLASKKQEYKDLIKIEKRELSEEEVNKIALLAPTATMNIIRKGTIHKKYNVKVPEFIVALLKCSNPSCVTNNESNIKTKFYLAQKNPLRVRCYYCERYMESKDLVLL